MVARSIVDFYGGDGSFDTLPVRTRDYIVAATPTNLVDWSSAWAFDVPLAAYAGITAPSLLVRGERGHPVLQRAAEVLTDAVSRSSPVTVPGASHFMIATHASDVARLIRGHVATVETLHQFSARSAWHRLDLPAQGVRGNGRTARRERGATGAPRSRRSRCGQRQRMLPNDDGFRT